MIFLKCNKLSTVIFSILCALVTSIAMAQTNVILVVDLDKAYKMSKFGQSIRKAFQLENESFNEENNFILESLKQEEIKLTKDRQELSPEDFSEAADAFDTKAVAIRADRL